MIGFLEAEAHFFIAAMNGGQSFSCGMRAVARDDDAELLYELREALGGSLRRRARHRTSQPQVVWTVSTRSDASRLADMLRRNPPIGRKARICEVWRQAVRTWISAESSRAVALGRRREELAAVASYTNTPPPARAIDLQDEFDRGYVTGLVLGDGHFAISPFGARLTMHLRDDDQPLLESLQAALGGSLSRHRAYRTSRPTAKWIVSRPDDLGRIRDGLAISAFPSRKWQEFELWSAAIDEQLAAGSEGRPRDGARLAALTRHVRELRAYRPPRRPLEVDDRRARHDAAMKQACHRALATFAAEHQGVLESAAYMRLRSSRHAEWPSRNTITRHFGTWHAALAAAGLSRRAATSPTRYASRSRKVLEVRRAAQQQRVLASVRRLARELDRPPRAMEYFRWRLARDPDTPTQATVYKLFPGGWAAVLEALAS